MKVGSHSSRSPLQNNSHTYSELPGLLFKKKIIFLDDTEKSKKMDEEKETSVYFHMLRLKLPEFLIVCTEVRILMLNK